MITLSVKMKKALGLVLLCIIPSFAFSEELVSYHQDESETIRVIPDESVTRPLRQVRLNHPYAAKPHAEIPVHLTLTGLDEPLTQKYIEEFTSTRGKQTLAAIVKRGGPYLTFIRSEVERRGLPHELIYLPVIESAFRAEAVSRSGAMGLWQFMKNSIAPHDMKITDWLDERRDFWKSTAAALDKLETEYKRVGSWELALAAYNAGLGTVFNAQKKYPGADYWELCRKKAFKNETIQYVPRLVAAAWVLSNPRRYGIEIEWPEDPQWTRIPVGRPVDLVLVAEYAGIEGFDLKKANAELHYGITPPDPSYHLKVPASLAPVIASVLENEELTLIKYYIHTIRSGDTIWGITRHYGITESQLISQNPGVQNKFLKIGAQLIIPALKELNGAAVVPKTSTQQKAAPASYTGTHLVKKGETLWSIARAYNIDSETLARANNMGQNDVLRAGSTLITPGIP